MKKLFPLLISIAIIFPSVALQAAGIEGGYKDGLFIKTEDGDFSLKTNLHMQFQYQFLKVEGAGNTNGFQIRRNRLYLSGNAFDPDLTYMVNFRFVDGRTNNVSEAAAYTAPGLLDGYVNYKFNDSFQVKAGQYKVPFSLEELIPDTALQFIDRSISNDVFSFNRDMGVTFHGKLAGRTLGYSLFVMDDGSNLNGANRNDALLVGGRFSANFLGNHGITSGDPANSEERHWMGAVGVTYNRVGAPTAADMNVIAMTADTAYRYAGFSTLGAVYFFRNQSAATNTLGFLGQTGYYFIPERFEVMARFTGVRPTAAGVPDGYEGGGGIGYSFKGHNVKLVADYAALINSPLVMSPAGVAGAPAAVGGAGNIVTTGGAPGFVQDQIDHRVRTQFQLFF